MSDTALSVKVEVDDEELQELRDLLDEIEERAEEMNHRLANAEPAHQPDEDGDTDE